MPTKKIQNMMLAVGWREIGIIGHVLIMIKLRNAPKISRKKVQQVNQLLNLAKKVITASVKRNVKGRKNGWEMG